MQAQGFTLPFTQNPSKQENEWFLYFHGVIQNMKAKL